jgi:hypothetical protein
MRRNNKKTTSQQKSKNSKSSNVNRARVESTVSHEVVIPIPTYKGPLNSTKMAEFEMKWGSYVFKVEEIHKDVKEAKEQQQKRNEKTSEKFQFPNFEIGDFVMYARVTKSPLGKLMPTWIGPYRIIDTISDWVYKIENILTKEIVEAHIQKLRFYDNETLNVTEDIRTFVQDSTSLYEIEDFLGIKEEEDGLKILVKWLGFSEEESTWEPMQDIYSAVPKMVKKFLQKEQRLDLLHVLE